MNNHFWHATLVVFTVMLPILTIGYARAHDHEHPEMNNHFWHATLVVFTVMLPILTIGYARAHDHEHPELNSWYESLHSGEGLCCDGTDAKRVDDADWETPERETLH